MTSISSTIEVNDIFDELSNENQRLLNDLLFFVKCLNVFKKFKTFVDSVFNNYKIDFNSNDSLNYQKLNEEFNEVLKPFPETTRIVIQDNIRSEKRVANVCPNEVKTKTNSKITFKCSINGCQYKTCVTQDIEQHIDDRHTDLKKPFECQFCNKRFLIEISLKTHLKRDHSKQIADQLTESMVNLKESPEIIESIQSTSSEENIKKFKCDFDGCYFETHSEMTFKAHKDSHPFGAFVCDYNSCGRDFYTANNLIKHIKDCHKKQKVIKSKLLLKSVKTSKNIPKVINRYKCQSVGSDFQTKKLSTNQSKVGSVEPLECTQRRIELIKKNNPNEAKAYINTKILYKCDINGCQYRTCANQDMEQHFDERHTDLKKLFECQFCSKRFLIEISLKTHLKSDHSKQFANNLSESMAESENTSEISKSIQMTSSDKLDSFNDCSTGFKLKSLLNLNQNQTNGLKYKCNSIGCDYKTNYWSHIISHQTTVHRKQEDFNCHYKGCNKSFKTSGALNLHYNRMHLNIRPKTIYECDEPGCQYKANTKCVILIHKSTHSNERPFNCTFDGCSKSFKTKYILKSHIEWKHTKHRRFKCEECDISFDAKPLYRYHLIKEHSKTVHVCDWPGCGFTTKVVHIYKQHRLTHKSVKDILCDWPGCTKGFKTKGDLSLHMRIHLNRKPFACEWPGCDYRSTQSSNLKQHKKIHMK